MPEGGVERTAEDSTEYAHAGRRRSGSGGGNIGGDFVDERGAVRADGNEKMRVAEGEMERAKTAHRDAGDGSIGAAGSDSIAVFDKGEKFLRQKILVAGLAVLGIDVETRASVRSRDQKIFQLVVVAEIFDDVPCAGVDEELFIVAESMEEIEDGEAAGFVGVEGSGENDAVGNGAGEDFAGDGVALYAAGGGVECGGEEEKEGGQKSQS